MGSGLLPKSSVISSLCDEVPSHIYSKIASRAQRIFDQQCKKTFATISANCGHCSRYARAVRPAGILAQEHQEMSLFGFLQLPIRAQLVHDGWKMLCKSPKYLVDWQTK